MVFVHVDLYLFIALCEDDRPEEISDVLSPTKVGNRKYSYQNNWL